MEEHSLSESNASLLRIKHGALELTSKPGAQIQYSYVMGSTSASCPLVIFLNGLMSDKASWLGVIAKVTEAMPDHPTMLAYDRYGQGLTEDRDPGDKGREPGYGHDVLDVANDLHQLTQQFLKKHHGTHNEDVHIILVAGSIGCAIARIYAQEYPGRVAGLLLLDSIMANSNFDFWPDPDAKDFDPESLPDDITVEILREQRSSFASKFSPSVINPEGLDRRNLASLLPYSDAPKLNGPGSQGPYIIVVGHDPETFAQEGLEFMRTPLSLTMKYTNPIWHEYNKGLLRLTGPERGIGPMIAPDVGHFIQRNVIFVVRSILTLIYFVCEVG